MIRSNIQPNLDKLALLLKKTPNATHAYMITSDEPERYVDIPIAQAEFTIRNHKDWTLESLAVSEINHPGTVNPWKGKADEPGAPADTTPVELPPKPSDEKKDESANTDTTPIKFKYRCLKGFTYKEISHKFRDVLELTEEEAAAFPADSIKKIDG